jgi:hypothetical protein
MFKGIKKVLAGFLAAAIALTPVSSTFAATSPAVKIVGITQKSAKPVSSRVRKQIDKVYTSVKGYTLIEHVTSTAKAVTYNHSITVYNGNAVDKNGKVVAKNQKIAYTINGVRNGAFKDAKNVESVKLGTSCRKLEDYSFAGAKKLTKIILKSTKLTTVGENLLGKKGTASRVNRQKVHVYVSGKYFRSHRAELMTLKKQLRKGVFLAMIIHMSKLF